MNPKNQKASKQKILQNESYQSICVNLKNIFQALHKPQTSPTWPKKAHNDPKIPKNQKVRKQNHVKLKLLVCNFNQPQL